MIVMMMIDNDKSDQTQVQGGSKEQPNNRVWSIIAFIIEFIAAIISFGIVIATVQFWGKGNKLTNSDFEIEILKWLDALRGSSPARCNNGT